MDAVEDSDASKASERSSDHEHSSRVEGPRQEGSISSGTGQGQASPGSQDSDRTGSGDADAQGSAHRLRERHRSRVHTQADVERIEDEIEQAFREGDPQKAWQSVHQLLSLAKGVVRQAAIDRFQANFGTSVCNNCEGLKAGPGVVATCFQIRQCYYDNVRQQVSPRKRQVIERLVKD